MIQSTVKRSAVSNLVLTFGHAVPEFIDAEAGLSRR
jgi:hypothetical protein